HPHRDDYTEQRFNVMRPWAKKPFVRFLDARRGKMDNSKAGLRSAAVASVAPRREARRLGVELSWAIPIIICGSGLEAMTLQSVLAEQAFSDHFISPPLRRSIIGLFGGKLVATGTSLTAQIDYLAIFALVFGFSLVCWFAGAAWLRQRGRL